MPPPAEGFAARFVVGPVLRTQPDGRLVKLVREGYENAFEEIVRRYSKALTRYAAAIVGGRAEDVTQDAFSKALLALRRDGKEIELRPWLFRIVRNTALNELRDRPVEAEALAEAIVGGATPEEEVERREELADLMRRLQSLPEAQRAAIVMRELEGLGHDEIAAALGLSGGGARQAIFRARRALRDGAGMLLPLPLLKALVAGAASAPVEAAGVGGVAGAGIAAKATVATVLVAGAVGAGVAIDHNQPNPHQSAPVGRVIADDSRAAGGTLPASGSRDGSGSNRHGRDDDSRNGDDRGRHSSGDRGSDGGHGSGDEDSASAGDGAGKRGPGGSGHFEADDDHGGRDSSAGRGEEGGDDGERRSGGSSDSGGSGGSGSSGADGSSSSGPGSGSSGSGSGVSGGDGSSGPSGSGPGSSTSDNSGSGSSGDELSSGSGSGSSGGSGSNDSGGDLSDSSGSGDSQDGDGFSLQTQPQS